ncbi:DUF1850 domain-containing protein [Pseudooceanicola onchidii]|uniref:DUF1850 domain-containing protein n=1 Tax=Pseudooceanicola onchidii TaxID=2562279 RepID=UPI0010AA6602|nr:DUF1850 domain-containing protein [Pseudooceanicola onchidii]
MAGRRSLRHVGRAACAALLLAPACPVRATDAATWLCLTETRGTQSLVARLPLGDDRTFDLSFIHSVSRTLVTDSYVVETGEIIQTREVFVAHGAGLPSIANDMDATAWRHENGQFILDMRRHTGPIPLRVQAQFKNTLHIADKAFPLADLGHAALTLAPCDEETSK